MHRQSGIGFSNTPKSQGSKKQSSRKTTDPIREERQALNLINKGKLNEAEMIYKKLLEAGSKSYTVHGNFGAILKIKGDAKNAIIFLKKAVELNPNYPEAHNNLGIALNDQGDRIEAILSYKTALKLNPNYSEAYYNLGNTLKEEGDITGAIDCYNSAIKLNPNYRNAYNNLGIALNDQGNRTKAISCYRAALDLDPNFAEARNNLGNSLKEQGDIAGAIECYKHSTKLNPNNTSAHINLGNSLQEQGNISSAIASYQIALKVSPNNPDAYYNLGRALQEQGNLNAAMDFYKTALKLNPRNPEIYYSLGIITLDQGDPDEALKKYEKVLDIDPTNSNALYGMGRAHAVKGNFTTSKILFENAIEKNPNNTAALFELSTDIDSEEDLKELDQKLARVSRSILSTADKSMLEFALSNFYHKKKDYINATQHLANANKLKLSIRSSDLCTHLLKTKQIAELAGQICEGKPSDGAGKIFIVGAPRCGSTLLESVLTTNPEIRGLGESPALPQAFTHIKTMIRAKKKIPALANIYAQILDESSKEYRYSVDKNLYNFRFIEAIARAMPEAKVIHCRRNPLDNVLSMLKSNLNRGNDYTNDALESAKFLIHQERIMRDFKSRYGEKIFTFNYDSFTNKPEKTLRPLINWLGLEWSDHYLHPEEANRHINTASIIQARQPINNRSVEGWKNYRDLLRPAENALTDSKMFELSI